MDRQKSPHKNAPTSAAKCASGTVEHHWGGPYTVHDEKEAEEIIGIRQLSGDPRAVFGVDETCVWVCVYYVVTMYSINI